MSIIPAICLKKQRKKSKVEKQRKRSLGGLDQPTVRGHFEATTGIFEPEAENTIK